MPAAATPEGTARYRKRFEEGGLTAAGHFRLIHGLYLTSLGMGTYLGEADAATDQLVEAAVKLSVESGAINVLDAAINYRFQRAERSIGRALRSLIEQGAIRRDELFVSTKNGYLTHDGELDLDFWAYVQRELIKPGIVRPEDISSSQHCMTVPFLRDQLERSRRNLGLETIDLLYLHNPVESQLQELGRDEFLNRLRAAFQFYEDARRDQRIQFYGLATWSSLRVPPHAPEHLHLEEVVDLAREVAGRGHGLRFIQLPFNLAMHEAFTLHNQVAQGQFYPLLQAAKMLGVGVFTSVPLLQGQLLSRVQLPELPMIKSPALFCLQFARSAPGGIVAPLIGQKEPEHVRENVRLALVPPYAPEEFAAIYLRRR